MVNKNKDKNTWNVKKQGVQKRRRYCFKKGEDPNRYVSKKQEENEAEGVHIAEVNRPIKRHTKEQLKRIAKKTDANEYSIPGADGIDGSAMIMRHQPSTSPDSDFTENPDKRGRYNVEEGNILIEKSRFFELLNDYIKKHEQLGRCTDLKLDLIEFEPWGLFSKAVVICKSCNFKSKSTKLYEEVPSSLAGRKAAAGNVRLQLLLQDLPIGQTEMQLLFASVGLRAGSLSGMQKLSMKAAKATEELAEADIRKWRELTKRVLADRGVLNINHFSAQYDVRYNGVFRASGKTPGPGARQATAACLETVTSECKVIGIHHDNSHCPKGSRLRGKGKTVTCGQSPETNHPDCVATLPPGRPIRERNSARHIAEDLAKDNIFITNLTTDCDADGKAGFEEVNRRSTQPVPTWYKDLTHTSRNMKQKILKHKFNNKNSPYGLKGNGDKRDYQENEDCKKALALDVPDRVAITLHNTSKYYLGDTDKIYSKVERIAAYMLLCYKGDHHSCRSAPLAQLTGCKGGGKNSWFKKSSTLTSVGISKLNLDKDDTEFLKSVIGMKLSKRNIIYYEKRATTSRTESFNKTVSKSLPKQKNWPVNSKARVCSAVGRHNNSLEDFMHMKCKTMKCPLPANDQGTKVLRRYQRHRDKIAAYQKKESTIKRRRELRDEDRKNYFRERKRVTDEGAYHKNQFEEALSVRDTAYDLARPSDNEPQPSTSFENILHNATRANNLVKKTIRNANKHNSSEIKKDKKKKRKQRQQKRALRSRNEAKNEARRKGSNTQIRLRSEHSYGSLSEKMD